MVITLQLLSKENGFLLTSFQDSECTASEMKAGTNALMKTPVFTTISHEKVKVRRLELMHFLSVPRPLSHTANITHFI